MKNRLIILSLLLAGLLSTTATPARAGLIREDFNNREMLVYVPAQPAAAPRPLVVVLHGGMGNANHIMSGPLNLNDAAEANGFIVAYLNGTPVTRLRRANMLGWNAGGGCCGQSAANNIDDIGYISGAVSYLANKYQIDRRRIYGIGHSNGAMMTQRLMCETNLYTAAIAVSGPLNIPATTCPAARGKSILAIHGAEDQNVPIAGGQGSQGLSNATYQSEAASQQAFERSGASYYLLVVPGAAHQLDTINPALQKATGLTMPEQAVRFFHLQP